MFKNIYMLYFIYLFKNDYEQLFSVSNDPNFDDNHLENIKRSRGDNTVPSLPSDITLLNAPISRLEVERSIYIAKLRRAAGFDGIHAEILRNPVCIDLIIKLLTCALRVEQCLVNGARGLFNRFRNQIRKPKKSVELQGHLFNICTLQSVR